MTSACTTKHAKLIGWMIVILLAAIGIIFTTLQNVYGTDRAAMQKMQTEQAAQQERYKSISETLAEIKADVRELRNNKAVATKTP